MLYEETIIELYRKDSKEMRKMAKEIRLCVKRLTAQALLENTMH